MCCLVNSLAVSCDGVQDPFGRLANRPARRHTAHRPRGAGRRAGTHHWCERRDCASPADDRSDPVTRPFRCGPHGRGLRGTRARRQGNRACEGRCRGAAGAPQRAGRGIAHQPQRVTGPVSAATRAPRSAWAACRPRSPAASRAAGRGRGRRKGPVIARGYGETVNGSFRSSSR